MKKNSSSSTTRKRACPELGGIFDDASEEVPMPDENKDDTEILEYHHEDDKTLDISDDDDDDEFVPDGAADRKKRKKKKRKPSNHNALPKQPKGSCSICGRRDFVTAKGAARHQAECDGSPKSKGPWKCSICGKSNFLTSQAHGAHWRCCNKGNTVTQASMSLEPAALENERVKLSNLNQLITKSIELFEASTPDVQRQEVGNGPRKIRLGDVGIRCRHCAQLGVLTIGSVSYTCNLKTVPHNMYTMVSRHLLETCHNVGKDLKHELLQAKKSSTRESMQKGAVGLPAYLRLLIGHYDLTDDGKKEGVRRKRVGVDEGQLKTTSEYQVGQPPVALAGTGSPTTVEQNVAQV